MFDPLKQLDKMKVDLIPLFTRKFYKGLPWNIKRKFRKPKKNCYYFTIANIKRIVDAEFHNDPFMYLK